MIIGAMKSATTSLFEYLAEHPAICPSRVKEPEYFSTQERVHDTRNRISDYSELWDFDPSRHAWAMEASTGYAKYEEPGVVGAILAAGLKPKFAYILRDPLARIESQYNFMRRKPAWRHRITDPVLVQTSNYYRFAKAYAEAFGRANLLLLDYEELERDPLACTGRVCAFLGLEPLRGLTDASARNVMTRPKSGLERAIRRAAPAVLSRAPGGVKAAVRRGFALIGAEKQKLSAGDRARIVAELRDGMARLHQEFGIDVARWGF
jgi:hypothetical protein